jgi:hypothetical protein
MTRMNEERASVHGCRWWKQHCRVRAQASLYLEARLQMIYSVLAPNSQESLVWLFLTSCLQLQGASAEHSTRSTITIPNHALTLLQAA